LRIKIRKSDQVFSKYICQKAKKICARCGNKTPTIQNSHFWGRKRENTRFDELNCDALCYGCHQNLGANPGEFRDWKFEQLGEKKYNLLQLRAQTYKKRDDKMDLIVAQQLLDTLDKSPLT